MDESILLHSELLLFLLELSTQDHLNISSGLKIPWSSKWWEAELQVLRRTELNQFTPTLRAHYFVLPAQSKGQTIPGRLQVLIIPNPSVLWDTWKQNSASKLVGYDKQKSLQQNSLDKMGSFLWVLIFSQMLLRICFSYFIQLLQLSLVGVLVQTT